MTERNLLSLARSGNALPPRTPRRQVKLGCVFGYTWLSHCANNAFIMNIREIVCICAQCCLPRTFRAARGRITLKASAIAYLLFANPTREPPTSNTV